jgi:hypothetical protein
MDTLIAIGSLAAYFYSLFQMFQGSLHLYFDTASMLVTIVLLGRYIESHARDRVSRGISDLFHLAHQKVRLLSRKADQCTPTLSLPEGVKNSEFSPSPYPLPPGERVNILKYKKKFPPPRRGRARVGVEMGFFHTFPRPKGEGIRRCYLRAMI